MGQNTPSHSTPPGALGQGGRTPPTCPICHAPAVLFIEETYTNQGPIVIRTIVCPKCYAAGRTCLWEVGRYNKYRDQK